VYIGNDYDLDGITVNEFLLGLFKPVRPGKLRPSGMGGNAINSHETDVPRRFILYGWQ
jgi:hypothetical protein